MLLIATRNAHKLAEMNHALVGLGIELKSAFDVADLPEIIEDADTLEGNALKKARETYRMTGIPSVADDTGLEVDALDGRPGVWSARYAGPDATYERNVSKLLDEMAEVPEDLRSARFRTVIAYAGPIGDWWVDGVCEGDILNVRTGEGGFGYDPVFRPSGFNRTFAEMTLEEKNAISHRGRAMKVFADRLRTFHLK